MTAMSLSSVRSSNDRVGVSARQSQWRREMNSLPALRPGRIGVGWSSFKTRQTPRDCREPHEKVACRAENTSLAQSGSPDLDATKLKAALGSFAVVLRKFCVAAAFLAVTNKVLRGQGLNTLAFLGIQLVVPVLIFKKLIKFSSFEALAATLAVIPSFWAAVARFMPAHHMTLTDVHFSARFMLPATVVEAATSSNFLGKGVGFLTASFPGTGLARWVYILTWLVISAFAYTSLKLRCWNPAKWAQVQHPEPPQSSNGDCSAAEAQEEIARLRQQVHDLQLSSQAGSVHQDNDKTRLEGETAASSDSSPSKEVSVPGPPATPLDSNVDDEEGDGWSTVAEFQVDTDDGPQPVPQAKAKDPAEATKPSMPAEMLPSTASPPPILGLRLGSLDATEVSSSDEDDDDHQEVSKAWVESAIEQEMWAMREELRDDLYLEVEAVRETMETHLKNLPSRSFCARGDGAKHEFRLTDLKADLVKLQQTADISAPLKEMTSSIAALVDGFATQETEARKKAVSELSERVDENDLVNEVLRSNLREMEVQQDALEQRMVELTEQLKDSAESHSRHLSLQFDSLEDQIRALKEQVRSSDNLLENQQYRMDTLSSELDAFQEQRLAMDLVVEERLGTAQETEQQAQQAINAIEPPTPESDLGQLLLDGVPTQAEKTRDEYKKRTQEERPAYQLRNAARRGHSWTLEPQFVYEEKDRPHQPSDPTENSEEDEPMSGDVAKNADTPAADSTHKPKGDAEAWAPPADAGVDTVEGHSAHVASDDTEAQALKEIPSLSTADSPPAADQENLENFEVVIEVEDRLPATKVSALFKTALAEELPSLHARPVHEKPTTSNDNIINIRPPSKMVDRQLFLTSVEPETELSSWHLEVSPINNLAVPIAKPPQQTSVELDIHFTEDPPAFKDSWISKRADVEDSGYDEDDDYSSDKTTDSDDCFQAKYGWYEDVEYSDQEDRSEETDGAETDKNEENSSEDDSDKDEDNEVELVWISDSDRSDVDDDEEAASEDEDDDDEDGDDDLDWIKDRS